MVCSQSTPKDSQGRLGVGGTLVKDKRANRVKIKKIIWQNMTDTSKSVCFLTPAEGNDRRMFVRTLNKGSKPFIQTVDDHATCSDGNAHSAHLATRTLFITHHLTNAARLSGFFRCAWTRWPWHLLLNITADHTLVSAVCWVATQKPQWLVVCYCYHKYQK